MKNITMPQQPRAEISANSVYEAKESNCEPFCGAQLNQAGLGFHKIQTQMKMKIQTQNAKEYKY